MHVLHTKQSLLANCFRFWDQTKPTTNVTLYRLIHIEPRAIIKFNHTYQTARTKQVNVETFMPSYCSNLYEPFNVKSGVNKNVDYWIMWDTVKILREIELTILAYSEIYLPRK